MSFISREVLIRLLKASKCATNDPTRANLQTVRVLNKENNYLVNACNGHVLVSINAGTSVENLNTFLGEGSSVVFELSSLSRVELLLKSYPNNRTFKCNETELFLMIDVDGDVYSLKKSTRDYPNVEQAIPEYNDNDFYTIAFNPELLKKLHSSMINRDKNEGVCIHVNKHDPRKAVLVNLLNDRRREKSFGVLMPMAT